MNVVKASIVTLLAVVASAPTMAQVAEPPGVLDDNELRIRDRYEQALRRNPLQDQTFDKVYEGYLTIEGINAWIEKLEGRLDTSDDKTVELILLGRIHERQFKTDEAIDYLEQAKALGENRPDFNILLGSVYYHTGNDEKAVDLFTSSLDAITDPEKRGQVVRLLGALYLRQGKRDEAIDVWKRLTDAGAEDVFAYLELAEIYEDNRMWEEAIGTYDQLIQVAENDPYRQCRALRAIGRCQIQLERHTDAIATYEKALDLVAPGNWLFEDLKGRLVSVYQNLGDLEGLATYLQEKIAGNPGDVEFRDLLAETYTRMAKFDEAEAQYEAILERYPSRAGAYEDLIALHARTDDTEKIVAAYENLIELFPTEPDYLRRLGEVHLRNNDPDQAKETWRRLVADDRSAGRLAQLASWFEQYEFPEEAISAYEKALEQKKDKEWTFRLAALSHAQGDEEKAVELWKSVVNDESSAAEFAEVAASLESFNFREEAEALYRQAMEKAQEEPEYKLALAKNLMRQERAEEAAPLFEELAGLEENDYFRDRGERGLLDAYADLGILQEKQEEWEQAVEESPDDPKLLLKLARLYERVGNRPQAIDLYRRCVELAPDDPAYLRTLAAAYKHNRQAQDAIDALNELIENDKNRAGGYYRELLDIYLAADLKDEAIATGKKIVEQAPSDPEARLDLGQVYMAYQEPELALQQYRYALRLEPDEPDYHRQYGEALYQERRFGEAQEAYRKMLDTAKEETTRIAAIEQLTRMYQHQDRVESLVREFQNRIRNTPKRLAAYEELSAIYRQNGDVRRAVEALEEGYAAVDDKAPALRKLVRATYEAQDFEKIVQYYEELLAISGKPTAYELERLGKVYAQLGDMDKAREAWSKMVEDNPDDPKSYIAMAKVMMEEGFVEEGLAAKEKALELDPYNYTARFQYAQDLAANEQTDRALDQMETILELGEGSEGEEEESKEKKVTRRNRTNNINQAIYRFTPGYRASSYRSGNWRRSFAEFRPNVIQAMAGLAENSTGIEPFLQRYEEKVEENPADIQAKEDLLEIYLTVNQRDDALELAEELMAAAPNNTELIEKSAALYGQAQKYGRAIELMERLAETQPAKRKEAWASLLTLYMQNEQEEKATATVDRLLEEYPNEYSVITQVAAVLQRSGKMEQALAVYDRADTVEPRYRRYLLNNQARLHQQLGNTEEARALYEELLFSKDDDTRRVRYARRPRIYAPRVGRQPNSGYYGANQFMYTLRNAGVVQTFDSTEGAALSALLTLGDSDEQRQEIIGRIQGLADAYTEANSVQEQENAWNMGKVLTGYYISRDEDEKALALLQKFEEAGVDDAELYNLKIYIHERANDLAAMSAVYDQLAETHPAQARDILKARAHAALAADNYEKAKAHIRELFTRAIPPREMVELIQHIYNADEVGTAKALLEEHVIGHTRNSQALNLLATIHADEGNYDRAIELAREAWEQQGHGRMSGNRYYRYGGYYYSNTSNNSSLSKLHQYYKQAGRTQELIDEFEERLENQPGSIRNYEHLAQIYQLNGKPKEALAVYERLTEHRPHYLKARTQMAELMVNQGRHTDALEIYEDLVARGTSTYRTVSWRIRDLYQRMGQGEKLAEMEEKMVAKARNPDQLYNLGNQFQNRGEYKRAIELYEKAIQMDPSRTWMHRQIASAYQQMGRIDDALETYAKYIDSPVIRAQGYVDHYSLSQLVGMYKATGRLDELKEKTAEGLEGRPNDPVLNALEGHIAKQEHRFGEALTIFQEQLKTRADNNVINDLVRMAEFDGTVPETLDFLEQRGMLQNYWDVERLGKLYLAMDEPKKAREAWERDAQRYGGNYGFYRVFQHLTNHGLWEEAEDYYIKNRNALDDGGYGDNLDRVVAHAYVIGKGFDDVIDHALEREYRGRTAGLIRELVRFEGSGAPITLPLMEKFYEREPKNKELVRDLAATYSRAGENERALELYAKLVELDPHEHNHRRQYWSLLANHGRENEAVRNLHDWLAEEKAPDAYTLAARFFADFHRITDLVQLRDTALESVDPSARNDLAASFARHEASLGRFPEAKAELRSQFETNSDANTFIQYLSFLLDYGLDAEAHALFVAHHDAGYLDQYRSDTGNVYRLTMRRGDFETLSNVLWQHVRYSDRWNRSRSLDQAMRLAMDIGVGNALLAAMELRLLNEEDAGQDMLRVAAGMYETVNQTDKAIDLYRQILGENPLDTESISKLSGIFDTQGRHKERIALLANDSGAMDVDADVRNALNLVRAYHDAGRDDEAKAALDELRSWATDAHSRIQIGIALIDMKQYDDAIAELEDAVGYDPHYNDASYRLAQAYAHAGRRDDARNLWTEHRFVRDFQRFNGWLMDEELYETAIPILEELLKTNPGHREAYRQLAEASYNLGRKTAYRQHFAQGAEVFPDSQLGALASDYAHFLVEHSLVSAAVAAYTGDPGTIHARAIAEAFGRMANKPDKSEAEAIRDGVLAIDSDSPDFHLSIVTALNALDDKPAAAKWAARAAELPGLTFRQHQQIANVFVRAEQYDEAANLYRTLTENADSLFVTTEGLIQAYAASGDEETLEAALAKIKALTPYESHHRFFEALAAYHGDDTEHALAEFNAIIDDPRVLGSQLGAMAKLLEKMDALESAARAHARLAGGGFSERRVSVDRVQSSVLNRTSAAAKTIELYAKTGNVGRAAEHLAETLPPMTGQTQESLNLIAEHATKENLPSIGEAIASIIAAAPNHPRVSDLVGIYGELAERLGVETDPSTLLADATVSELELEQARLWDTLIEEWTIVGPFPADTNDNPFEADLPQAVVALAKGEAWNETPRLYKTNENGLFGLIDVHAILDKPSYEPNKKHRFYAVANIHAEHDGIATFHAATSDTCRIWINGKNSHRYIGERAAVVGQDAFDAPLKAGDNTIIVMIEDTDQSARFALGMMDGSSVTQAAGGGN